MYRMRNEYGDLRDSRSPKRQEPVDGLETPNSTNIHYLRSLVIKISANEWNLSHLPCVNEVERSIREQRPINARLPSKHDRLEERRTLIHCSCQSRRIHGTKTREGVRSTLTSCVLNELVVEWLCVCYI